MITLAETTTARWDHFGNISPKLGFKFFACVVYLKDFGYNDVIITSIIRPQKRDSGVHALGRGIDFVVPGIERIGIEKIKSFINNEYVYDNKRPKLKTLIHHVTNDYDDAGWHFHLQTMG